MLSLDAIVATGFGSGALGSTYPFGVAKSTYDRIEKELIVISMVWRPERGWHASADLEIGVLARDTRSGGDGLHDVELERDRVVRDREGISLSETREVSQT